MVHMGGALPLGVECVETHTGCPSPGVQHGEDKLPWLLAEFMLQLEWLENPKLYSGRECGCWPAKNQCKESFALVAAT